MSKTATKHKERIIFPCFLLRIFLLLINHPTMSQDFSCEMSNILCVIVLTTLSIIFPVSYHHQNSPLIYFSHPLPVSFGHYHCYILFTMSQCARLQFSVFCLLSLRVLVFIVYCINHLFYSFIQHI